MRFSRYARIGNNGLFSGAAVLTLALFAAMTQSCSQQDTHPPVPSVTHLAGMPLPDIMIQAVADANLSVDLVLDRGTTTELTYALSNLRIDDASGNLLGEATIEVSEGSHSITLDYFLLPSSSTARVIIANAGPVPITILTNRNNPANFTNANITYSNDDNDQFTNMEEVRAGLGYNDATSPPVHTNNALYSNAPNWNSYVLNNGSNLYNATNTPCTGAERNGYRYCIHGGERRVTTLIDQTSCAGVTASDSLNAFDWTCNDGTGAARVISMGLKNHAGLSDLIDFDAKAWRSMGLKIYRDGIPIGQVANSVWWSNNIGEAPPSGGNLSPGQDGYIYLVSADRAASYTLAAGKLAMLIKPGVTLQGPGNNSAPVVSANTQNFLWLEGRINAIGDQRGVYFQTGAFWVLRNVAVANATGDGIGFLDSDSGLYQDIVAVNNGGYGMVLNACTRDTFINIRTTLNSNGFAMTTCGNSVVNGLIADNNTNVGLIYSDSLRNVFSNILSVNNGGVGIRNNAGDTNLLKNLVVANNGGVGIQTSYCSSNNFADTILANNASGLVNSPACSSMNYKNLIVSNHSDPNGAGIKITGSSATPYIAKFDGLLRVGNNSTHCDVPISVVSSLGLAGDGNCTPISPSTATLTLDNSVDARLTHSGQLISNDRNNSADSNGVAEFAFLNNVDWVTFEHPYRTWSSAGSGFLASDTQGKCGNGQTCRIIDWRLKTTDVLAKNARSVPVGSDIESIAWTPFAVGSTSPSTTYLENSVEIFADDIGNDNGLCESNEACLFTPNIGAYQGHGELIPMTGIGTGATLVNITLYQHNFNGQ